MRSENEISSGSLEMNPELKTGTKKNGSYLKLKKHMFGFVANEKQKTLSNCVHMSMTCVLCIWLQKS